MGEETFKNKSRSRSTGVAAHQGQQSKVVGKPAARQKSAAQQERKRIQDRESQRNVRQRTRAYIASLEARLEALESPDAVADLIAENNRLKAEIEELCGALASISALAESKSAKHPTTLTAEEKAAVPESHKDGVNTAVTSASADASNAAPSVTLDKQEKAPHVLPGKLQSRDVSGQQVPTHEGPPSRMGWPIVEASSNSGLELPELTSNNSGSSSGSSNSDEGSSYENTATSNFLDLAWEDWNYTSDTLSTLDASLPTYSSAFEDHLRVETWGMDTDCNPMLPNQELAGGIAEPQVTTQLSTDSTAYNNDFGLNADVDMISQDLHSTTPATFVSPSPGSLGRTMSPAPRDHGTTGSMILPQILPQSCSPTNIWDTTLLNFISQRQSFLLSHYDPSFFEPDQPDMGVFFSGRLEEPSSSNETTRFLAESIKKWNFKIPEKFAMLWLNYIYLKYRIAPTDKNAEHLPHWFSPRASQCVISHPIYVDTLPWPRLRDKLTFEYEKYPFPQFVEAFCRSLDVSWRREDSAAYDVQPDGRITLSSPFLTHLRTLENWKLTSRFSDSFPELAREIQV